MEGNVTISIKDFDNLRWKAEAYKNIIEIFEESLNEGKGTAVLTDRLKKYIESLY